MKHLATLALLLCPALAQAGDLAIECGTPDPERPEMGAHLVRFEGENKGRIVLGDQEFDAMVLPGLEGAVTFLHIGDGYTFQYAVNVKEGRYDYSASGSRQGHQRGECRVLEN